MGLIQLTEKAAIQLKAIAADQKKEGYGLRVWASHGGCSGLQYGIKFEEFPAKEDQVVESFGIRLFMDPQSASYLEDAELDYEEEEEGGFKFNNPNESGGCGGKCDCC